MYYSAIILPVIVLVYLSKINMDRGVWVALVFFYLLVYRTVTDYLRLVAKNVLGKNDFWKVLIPGFTFKYFRELYLP